MEAEGIRFVTNTEVGKDVTTDVLMKEFDAVVLCGGATRPRELNIDGRGLKGVYPAMEFLTQNTKSLLDSNLEDGQFISAEGWMWSSSAAETRGRTASQLPSVIRATA